MKIAIPYDNGRVFEHFGRAEQFKFYTVDAEEILSTEIIDTKEIPDTKETGHDTLPRFLKNENINLLICGGIAVTAVAALHEAGIQIMGGASGEADQQVLDFLNGKIHFETPGASCGGSCRSCSGCGSHADHDEVECDGNISACGESCGI